VKTVVAAWRFSVNHFFRNLPVEQQRFELSRIVELIKPLDSIVPSLATKQTQGWVPKLRMRLLKVEHDQA
jgi:hypothetical protein